METGGDVTVPSGLAIELENRLHNGQHSGFDDIQNNATTPDKYDIENNKNESEAKDSRGLLPFCIVFGFGSLFSSSLGAYMSSQITVLERTFGLSSSSSGILLSANDIGFVATVLVASHFLHRYHIPRILGACILVFGVSGILTSLPHFIMNEQMPSQGSTFSNTSNNSGSNLLCTKRTENQTLQNDCTSSHSSMELSGDNRWVLVFMATMMIIQGIAKSARQPLSTVYVDNNSKREKTGFYIGILSTFGIFGPMIAITSGGLFSKLPVDLKETQLKPEDPRWIGAWWLGFIVFGACALVVSLPVFCFPAGRKLPRHKITENNKSDCTEEMTEKNCCHVLKDLPKSIFRVLSRPIFTLNLIAVLLQMFSVMALGAFGPKYIENQFNIPTWKANVILGPEKLVTTVFGTIGGGLLTRRLKLGTSGCIKLILIARAISLFMKCFNFLFGCDNPPIVGLDLSISDVVNATCDCNGAGYFPVCADGLTFFSPCHAGCQGQTERGFTACLGSTSGDVTSGLCDDSCFYLIPFIATNALSSLIGTLVIAPTYVIVLRSVKERDRSMAVGLLSFLMSLLVFLPAPIVYGKLFDSLCLLWKNSCSGNGACSLYDVTGMRVKFNATDIGLRIACLLLTFLTFCCSRREPDNNETCDQENEIKPAAELELRNKKMENQTNGQAHKHRENLPEHSPGYVNVDVSQEITGQVKKPKPLPPIPDKRPMPSPRPSRC